MSDFLGMPMSSAIRVETTPRPGGGAKTDFTIIPSKKGAATGTIIGAPFGPIGMAVGAVIGAIFGPED